MSSTSGTRPKPSPHALAWYVLAALLVLVYVNTFPFWILLSAYAGPAPARLAPFAATAAALVLALVVARRRPDVLMAPLAAGCVIAVIALFLTDPNFPAKRIHVPQYLLLAIVVRRALSPDIDGPGLTVMTIVLTMLFGAHDELLQGLHANRSFGLRDLAINAAGGLAGALIGAGMRLFISPTVAKPDKGVDRATIAAAGIVFAAAILLLAPLEAFRDRTIPFWTMAPLLAAMVFWAGLASPGSGGRARPWRALATLAFTLLLYPLATHVTTRVFH